MIRCLRKAIGNVVLSLAITSAPAFAETAPVVVELFTSQGCSSCPPADRLMHDLAGKEDVIGLALHVDYWDYIGWKDSFGKAEHSQRQRNYAAIAGRRSVYTPQMIVNGTTSIVGAKPMDLMEAVAQEKAAPADVSLSISRKAGTVEIRAKSLQAQRKMIVCIIRYNPLQEVRIDRGENAGNTFAYANVVQDWHVISEWDGREDLALTRDLQGDVPVVVLVQEAPQGRILAAARLK